MLPCSILSNLCLQKLGKTVTSLQKSLGKTNVPIERVFFSLSLIYNASYFKDHFALQNCSVLLSSSPWRLHISAGTQTEALLSPASGSSQIRVLQFLLYIKRKEMFSALIKQLQHKWYTRELFHWSFLFLPESVLWPAVHKCKTASRVLRMALHNLKRNSMQKALSFENL